uniref:Uncharacterized protein n=1 Tax=Anguilla anguilla TaxID=7936 RepID=A0A0E9U1Y1_ANGAN
MPFMCYSVACKVLLIFKFLNPLMRLLEERHRNVTQDFVCVWSFEWQICIFVVFLHTCRSFDNGVCQFCTF